MERKKPRILVIRGGAIGDFILTLPAIRLIRETFSGCHLEVLGYPGIMDLALKAGLADSMRSLEHRSMALLFAKGATIDPALVEYLLSFNVVVSYLFDPDGILRGQLEGMGVKTLLECPHSIRPGQGHAAQQLAKPLEKLAMYLEEPEWRKPVLAPAEPAVEPKRIALHLGSGSTKKNWPVENWAQVMAALQQEIGAVELVLITGEAELERGVNVAAFRAEDHWHALPLPELADRLGTCGFFLGHDSGISHLAAACGVPCLLLFGPTDPALWAPPQAGVTVIQAEKGEWQHLKPEQVTAALMARLDEIR
ncbi:ADP-heptose:LPS heptosyltransferase [Prosthecobacter fusiformis]|uniref:ADP-heptose:LPS heptosyltransferase n=1 Tax=Prosthecobacter fusiformis TaxID=48464 RepID=A0A4R7SQ96_9BACT|nr:glycosyltransferase family 9 protein [Prosthecobacter fusiformis]TDU81412.1 ADP-heptose:LPS heptosyltransferase [Prosthecobacter fusiformis]